MAPCELEFRPRGQNQWLKVGTVSPGDPLGSISDVSKGQRDVYLFECSPDDSKTTIYKSRLGVDWNIDEHTRAITPLEKMESVQELKKGESFELEVTTERGHSGTFHFTHR